MNKKIAPLLAMLALSVSLCACSVTRDVDSSGDSNADQTSQTTELTTATGQIYVPVTDASGNNVTDSEGNAITTVQPVIITQIPQTTYVTVTDDKGEAVTDDKGEAVTTEQTIWVTTMQTVTTVPTQNDVTTTYTQQTTTTAAATSTTSSQTSTTTTTTAVTTTTADNSDSSESSEPSEETGFAYGALSTVVVDMIETTEDGEFIKLVFNVKDDAQGTYAVNVYDVMIADINLQKGNFATANGCVSVGRGIQTDVPTGGSPIVYIGSVEGFAGEQIVVPVYIKNNSGVSAFDFKVEYDSSGLELVSIDKGEIVDSSAWAWTVNTNYIPR